MAQWLELLIRMKMLKATVRGAGLTGSVIPLPAVGITTGVLAALVSTGGKLTYSKACVGTSLELHWRAKQEQFMAGRFGGASGGSVGPASRIIWELFTRRGWFGWFGNYDVAKLVQEPAGWHAINDKLLLI